jgi:hypothetical protein
MVSNPEIVAKQAKAKKARKWATVKKALVQKGNWSLYMMSWSFNQQLNLLLNNM